MTARPSRERSSWLRIDPRLVLGVVVGVAIATLVLANVHLVYVAVSSRPDCVDHLKQRGDPALGDFRAARPSC